MILNEQLYKNLYRPYFRGQRKDYLKSKADFDFTCFTTSPMYALFYVKKEHGDLFVYYLKNNINIFNAHSKKDFFNLHQYIIANNLNYEYSTLDRLKNEDWSFVLGGDDKRADLIDIIKKLGYDGFFNYEWTSNMKNKLPFYKKPDTDNNPAICVFNSDDCFISKKVDDLMSIKEIADFHKKEIRQIEDGYYWAKEKFGKETAHSITLNSLDDYLTISENELKDILEDLETFKLEEAKQILSFLENTKRPGFKEAAARLREEIDAQTK